MFQQSGRGLIIGEPTGGSKQGINGGQFFLLYLPYSGIEIDLPLIWQKPVSDAPDNGVVPDRIVYTSRAAICSGRDEQLEAAINSLQRKTK
jgi:C-terminal processing protease CtpA/Prc